MFIDENTSREDLINAITSTLDGVQFCIDRDIDPEDPAVETEVIRQIVIDFIEAGNEVAA